MTDDQYQQLIERLAKMYTGIYANTVYRLKAQYTKQVIDDMQKAGTIDDLFLLAQTQALQERLAIAERNIVRQILPKQTQIEQSKLGLFVSTTPSEEFTRLTQSYYNIYALDRAKLKATTTYNDLKNILQRANDKNMTIQETTRLIRNEMPLFNKSRANTIARTETMQSIDYANKYILEKTILEYELDKKDFVKTWLTALDERVRSSHLSLHGVTIELDDYFFVGGEQCLEPRDSSLSPSQAINCRCALSVRLKK